MKSPHSFVKIDDVLVNFDLVARIEIKPESPQAAAHATFWSAEGSLIFTWMPSGINKAGVIDALGKLLRLNATIDLKQ
jgi:hypothetical protein